MSGNHNSANSAPPAAEDTGNADNVAQNILPVPQADSATADQGSDGGVSSAATNGDRVAQPILGLEDAVAQGLLFQPIDVNAAVAATPSPDEDKDYTMSEIAKVMDVPFEVAADVAGIDYAEALEDGRKALEKLNIAETALRKTTADCSKQIDQKELGHQRIRRYALDLLAELTAKLEPKRRNLEVLQRQMRQKVNQVHDLQRDIRLTCRRAGFRNCGEVFTAHGEMMLRREADRLQGLDW